MTGPIGPGGGASGAYNPYATGHKVYGGSSGPSHATSGVVDPSGYADRSRRAGLAQAMLGRHSATQQDPSANLSTKFGEWVSQHPHSVLARLMLQRRMENRGGPR